ncbi:hypothetical protein [Lysinibacillus sp. NPDC086135]
MKNELGIMEVEDVQPIHIKKYKQHRQQLGNGKPSPSITILQS